jgi:hypothetical protein
MHTKLIALLVLSKTPTQFLHRSGAESSYRLVRLAPQFHT